MYDFWNFFYSFYLHPTLVRTFGRFFSCSMLPTGAKNCLFLRDSLDILFCRFGFLKSRDISVVNIHRKTLDNPFSAFLISYATLGVLRGKRVQIITPVPVLRSVKTRCWSLNTPEKTMGLGSKFSCGLLMEIVSGKRDWLSILTVRSSAGVTLRSISKDCCTRARKHESDVTKVDAT